MDAKAVAYKLRQIVAESDSYEELRKRVLDIANEVESAGRTQEEWDEVIENARFMLEEYKKIPTGIFGAMNISNAIERYDRGERTNELYDELESIE